MRRILVTGGSGFVGRHLLAALNAAPQPGDEVLVVSRDAAGDIPGFIEADLSDPDAAARAIAAARPTHVVHLAARSSASGSTSDPAGTWRNNLGTTQNLADAIAAHGEPVAFLFASSAQVYGDAFGGLSGGADENLAPRPANPYARSKLSEEWLLRDMLPRGSKLAILRLFNSVGPGQPEGFVLPDFAAQVARAERGGPAIVRSGDATKERDFLDVRDTVAAFDAVLRAVGTLPDTSIFNIASGQARTIASLFDDLAVIATVPLTFEPQPATRPGETDRIIGDTTLLRQATGWSPCIAWRDTIRDTLDWWRAHEGKA